MGRGAGWEDGDGGGNAGEERSKLVFAVVEGGQPIVEAPPRLRVGLEGAGCKGGGGGCRKE
jgi:hypothetical protein